MHRLTPLLQSPHGNRAPQPGIKPASRLAKVCAVFLIAGFLFLAVWLALARPNSRQSQQPEVTLVDLRLLADEFLPLESSTSGLTISDSRSDGANGWSATFEVRVPSGSALSLTNGPLQVEYSQADGVWIPAPDRSAFALLQGFTIVGRVTTRRLTLSLPAGTRNCRFRVGYRFPTLRERWFNTLSKTGIWKSCPKAAIMMANWVCQAPKDNWVMCQRTVPLVLAPMRSAEPTLSGKR